MLKRLLSAGYWLLIGGLAGSLAVTGVQYYFLVQSPVLPPVELRAAESSIPEAGGPQQPRSRQFQPVRDLYMVQQNQPGAEKTSNPSSSGDAAGNLSEESIQKIEESRLPFELLGTSSGAEPYEYAVLRHLESKNVRQLKSGDAWNALTVTKIADEWVQIRNTKEDRTELLELKRSVRSQLRSRTSSQDDATEVSRYQINRAIQNNMNNLLASVRAQPVMHQGNVVGFELKRFRGRAGKLLKKLGFREGDMILRVNGKRVNSMEKAFQLWTQLKNKKHFRVDIQRNGELKTLEYSLVR